MTRGRSLGTVLVSALLALAAVWLVDTPGSDDRGARRIVAGDGGELFYTDEHHESFRRVRR